MGENVYPLAGDSRPDSPEGEFNLTLCPGQKKTRYGTRLEQLNKYMTWVE